jgi:hypothetical protein
VVRVVQADGGSRGRRHAGHRLQDRDACRCEGSGRAANHSLDGSRQRELTVSLQVP